MTSPSRADPAIDWLVLSGKFGFVRSRWHRDVVEEATAAFLEELERRAVPRDRIDLFEVPGALEIPLHAKMLAESGRYLAIVACGFIVDGGIYRHEFVAGAVIQGLMSVQLETGTPVISAVLTPQRYHEHDEHRAFFRRHFRIKGAEAAVACVETVSSLFDLTNRLAGSQNRGARR
ncbi:MAG: 6,7-dimethyl-8-ribityllumazine synthase [Alphaproteobacteria bacterium]|nr:6,7-dimethyl-8-ribityllumazine synthase [Alphaproteobacteria bacterium]